MTAVLLVALAACGGETVAPDKAGPQDAVESLLRALNAGNCTAAKRVVVAPSLLDCGQVDETAGTVTAAGIDLDEVRYRVATVVANSTTVEVTTPNGNPQGSYDVQRVDGTWRVVFDSAA